MACLEHSCTRCSWTAFNNIPAGPYPVCPNCGGRVVTYSDEHPEPREIDEPAPEEEDES